MILRESSRVRSLRGVIANYAVRTEPGIFVPVSTTYCSPVCTFLVEHIPASATEERLVFYLSSFWIDVQGAIVTGR